MENSELTKLFLTVLTVYKESLKLQQHTIHGLEQSASSGRDIFEEYSDMQMLFEGSIKTLQELKGSLDNLLGRRKA
jgi:hypothetical protein